MCIEAKAFYDGIESCYGPLMEIRETLNKWEKTPIVGPLFAGTLNVVLHAILLVGGVLATVASALCCQVGDGEGEDNAFKDNFGVIVWSGSETVCKAVNVVTLGLVNCCKTGE